ncbi:MULTISPECIES: DUF4145 domain-containing protein [Pantoea]|uniref:DUF4145 domain-containing protein n=1 Tax=Pantoea TaxID=53335 RepID=UPI002592588A|nr:MULTISPECIES: DUF4145 domain-containing protein [Pantoea]
MSWVCPHCDVAAIIKDNDFHYAKIDLESLSKINCYQFKGITCPNPDCNKAVITLEETPYWVPPFTDESVLLHSSTKKKSIIPSGLKGRAKTYPSYIPEAIITDYKEACAIVELSPKSSATLSRRALQGMIRDFWQVKEENLSKAIKALEDKVDSNMWDAIDGIRKVGNIGAHMEKDINTIVEVNPGEATVLIGMIEMLLDEWYITRYEKEQRIKKMKKLADEKQAARKPQST